MTPGANPFQRLLNFLLLELGTRDIEYTLRRAREDTIMVEFFVPGEHYEVEFFVDGHIEVEVYRSVSLLADHEAEQALKLPFEEQDKLEGRPD